MESNSKIFISYSHDSDAHREKVLALSERLRADGIETLLDQYVNGSPEQGWPRWMLDQLDAATFVLVICTETYYRRFRGHEAPGKGKGADWEGALITQEIYDSRSQTLKFVPVFLTAVVEEHIPEPLRPHTHYALTSEDAYQRLYDFLLRQAGVEPGSVGMLKKSHRRKGTPLTFDGPAQASRPVDISRIVKYAPAELIGREAETALLNDVWAKVRRAESPRPHILTLVALGGEGKTSLVAKWASQLAYQNWPGCDAVFAWSFYSQGTRDQVAASSDLFLKEALNFFGDDADKEFAASNAGAFEKGQRLARIVGERRALLILDGLEPLQYAPTSPTPGELKDQGIAALLKGLAANSHGLCIVTTRYALPDLRAFIGNTVHEEKLTRLSTDAGVALLQSLGVHGILRKTISSADGRDLWNEYEKLVEDVKGHALTLNLLGTYLRDAHAGDIRQRDLIKLEVADATNEHRDHAWHVMEAYVKWMAPTGLHAWLRRLFKAKDRELQAEGNRALSLLRLLGLFDRPATADCLKALWQPPAIAGLTEPLVGLSEAQRNLSLKRLEDAKLLTVNRAQGSGELIALDAHPLLREYFARRVRQQEPEAWRAAHQRLYEHLCATTPDEPEPMLEDLQPLYQAVAHGCQAGITEEARATVYRDRIQRGREAYSTFKLGALGSDLGAIACFFKQPWSELLPAISEGGEAWLLNEAAFTLRALGRLTEALEPMRANLKMRVEREEWQHAPSSASNLSELELTLGEVAGAVGDAKQSVTYADRSGDAYQRIARRTAHADALHQAGSRAKAEAQFREAEQMQAEHQRAYALLYSVRGFEYCDLLLAEGERAAWQMRNAERGMRNAELIEACRAVSQRAAQTLKWVTKGKLGLLTIALDHLTLGRAALYAGILEDYDFRLPTSDFSHIDAAVSGLRRAGTQNWIPAALLTRAWLRSLTGARTGPESAQSDLDEAWEIAERGSMRLFLADIHLHRARLFGLRIADFGLQNEEADSGVRNEAAEPYPWESPEADLAAAEKLINDCGYHRRDEELADAKKAILGQELI
ncbi:MAG: TIR and AAA domain-containing protein [Acidobacteriota bacterium]